MLLSDCAFIDIADFMTFTFHPLDEGSNAKSTDAENIPRLQSSAR